MIKQTKFRAQVSMPQLYNFLQNSINNAKELIDDANINKELIKQIINSGNELLTHIKNYVKNDIMMLFISGRKSKIKNKKKIMQIFTKKAEVIITTIGASLYHAKTKKMNEDVSQDS